MSSPIVSILTPTYNHASLIASTIASVQAQSVTDWEMIVIDDGSDDGTAEAAEAVGDERVRIFRERHRGIDCLAETYNRGLAESRADLIGILEGDDLWAPGKLETQLPDFQDSEVAVSAGRIEIDMGFDQDRSVFPIGLPGPEAIRNSPIGSAGKEMMRPWVLTFTWPLTVVVRKGMLVTIGGFQKVDYLPIVDFPTLLNLSLAGQWRVHEVVLGTWRRHEKSVTRSRFPEILEGVYRYAAEFAQKHGEVLGLSAEECRKLESEWTNLQVDRLMLLGRMLAARKSYRKAAACFLRAGSFIKGSKTAAMLSAAALSCRARVTPEWVMRLGKRKNWMDLAEFGDPKIHEEQDPENFFQHRFC